MIIILDFGSQYTELIARRIRESSVYSEVISHDTSLSVIQEKYSPKGIILSGGPSSIFDDGVPKCDPAILESGIPILGVCYGMQLISHHFGGEVKPGDKHEYGPANLLIDDNFDLFEGLWLEMSIWMSHGDSVMSLPEGFESLAHTANCKIAAIGNRTKKIYGVQFHPEVTHTPRGMDLIRNFVHRICGCKPDWTPASFLEKSIKDIQEEVGENKVLCGLSGGVDSTVVAMLLHKAIGDRLTCVFIDQGFMRKNEAEAIKKLFTEKFNINLIYVDEADRFFDKLKDVTDPEEKRKRIGEEFVRVFEAEEQKLGGDFKYLAQGTLYSDVIESAAPDASDTAAKIKTHHNVGGLPEDMTFKVIEPLRTIFKDEARKVGLELKVPEEVVFRQPFPGPGLAIRILGEVTKDRVALLQNADAIVLEVIKEAGLYRELWQSFAVLLPIRSVGVMGDKRTYQHTIAIRAVTSDDAMTASWAQLPYEVLDTLSTRIINEVDGVNRVVYDITSKPPGTIEWE
ncbi:GMP synthase (glutamine-hydrolyzing) [Candidatus Marinamargulisbacteria bacterium SCGC AG-439-L15]|nr:GMP synthase (glutamine-hydrolyzing) [Candidatus Marinamargulisbacteria bacterium SCGC AG-439-L15]